MPDSKSHILIVLSSNPDNIFLLSGLIAIELTQSVCPCPNVLIKLPDSRSHILTVLSHDTDTIFLLSGLIANEVIKLVCPFNVLIKLPDYSSNII